jgi:hypothetical protein
MADIDVHYDPISVNTDTTTVEVKGLDDVHLTLSTPQPLKAEVRGEVKGDLSLQQTLKSDNRNELIIPQPIKTESAAKLDVQPLAVDQCMRISFGPLPPTCVRQPYHQHFGFTFFGVEIFGFNLEGEGKVLISDLPPKPQVLWGEQPAHQHPDKDAGSVETTTADGLRIRLDR